jgi:hypothetical protein
MSTHPTRAAEKQEGTAPHAQRQPLAAHGVPEATGLAARLLALQKTHGNQFVQRFLDATTHGDAEAPVEVEAAIQRTRGGGHPLHSGVRGHMESAFGTDFSSVRVHTDTTADALNRSLSALAFTTGHDVYFRQGQYDPEGASGRRLLAHELTHVVQQAGAAGQSSLIVGAPGDAYEQEADHVADAVMHSLEHDTPQPMSVAGGAQTNSIQRMCTACAQGHHHSATAIPEEEERVAGGMRAGIGGGCCAGHAGANPLQEDLIQPGVGGHGVARISGSATLKIQRQPLTVRGDVGCPVPELQEALNATGEALVVDGRFGPLTEAAVRRFQTAHPPLAVDGDVGPLTWPELHTAAPGDHGLPAGETTTTNGWSGGGVHQWRQRLTPFNTIFGSATAGHCQVREADGGGGTDTCHFAGSTFAPFTAITGGTWDVDDTNHWGDDFVGWFAPAVNFYRANGRAPCFASFLQSMRVVRTSGDVEYRVNRLTSSIGTTTVSSTRDGQTETRVFP